MDLVCFFTIPPARLCPCRPPQDKRETIARLMDKVKRGRVALESERAAADAALRDKLAAQKAKSEAVLKRQLAFIDGLLKDKGELNAKVDELSEELRAVEHGWSKRLKAMERSHAVALQRQKDRAKAEASVTRAAWMKREATAIEAATIRKIEKELEGERERYKAAIGAIRDECEERVKTARAEERQACKEEVDRLTRSVDSKVADAAAAERREWMARERRMREEWEDELRDVQRKHRQALQEEEQRSSDALRAERVRAAEEVASLRATFAQLQTGVREATDAEEERARAQWKRSVTDSLTRQFEEREKVGGWPVPLFCCRQLDLVLGFCFCLPTRPFAPKRRPSGTNKCKWSSHGCKRNAAVKKPASAPTQTTSCACCARRTTRSCASCGTATRTPLRSCHGKRARGKPNTRRWRARTRHRSRRCRREWQSSRRKWRTSPPTGTTRKPRSGKQRWPKKWRTGTCSG